jgi:hypothetical protein
MKILKIALVLILCGAAYNLFKFDKSPESLMHSKCECYDEAKRLQNSSAMSAKMKECEQYGYAFEKKLNEQAKEEDWPDNKLREVSNQLFAKYCGNPIATSNSTGEVTSSNNITAQLQVTNDPRTEKDLENDRMKVRMYEKIEKDYPVIPESLRSKKRPDIYLAKEVDRIFRRSLPTLALEGRELKVYSFVTGDLNGDGIDDEVLQYSLMPTADDLGGDGVSHPSKLTGLVVYVQYQSGIEMVTYNNTDGFSYQRTLASIEDGIINLYSPTSSIKIKLIEGKLVRLN